MIQQKRDIFTLNLQDILIQNDIKGVLKQNVKAKNLTWFKTGGLIKYLFMPEDSKNLQKFLALKLELPIYVLGQGSNVLVRQGGFEGVVIKLSAPYFTKIEAKEQNIVKSGAFATDYALSDYAMQNNIKGFEFLSCIPGALGGALAMNAGASGSCIEDIFVSAKAIDFEGNELNFTKDDVKFSYRNTTFPKNIIFTSAILKGENGSKEKIQEKITNIKETRQKSQPLGAKTGGSTFKNPKEGSAWSFIEKVGLRGYLVGGACFSDKHCNFMINNGNATSQDIEDLCDLAIERVLKEFGVKLELEIKIIGKA